MVKRLRVILISVILFGFVFSCDKLCAYVCNSCQTQFDHMNTHKRHRFLAWFRTPRIFSINHDTLRIATLSLCQDSEKKTMTISQLMDYTCKYNLPSCAYISLSDDMRSVYVSRGLCVRDEKLIVIFSRGYAKRVAPTQQEPFIQRGGGISAAYLLFRDQILTDTACVTFDYPDERDFFNFGQETDYACLKYVYTKTMQANPDAHILIIGDCRGAKVALDFAAERPKNLAGLILFSPFFSAWGITQQLAKNYLKFLPAKEKILHGFFRTYYPNYYPEEKDLCKRACAIQPDLPIFIGHRIDDTLVSNAEMYQFVDTLKNSGHTRVQFTVLHDHSVPHSRLTPHTEIQHAVQSFLEQYIYFHPSSN